MDVLDYFDLGVALAAQVINEVNDLPVPGLSDLVDLLPLVAHVVPELYGNPRDWKKMNTKWERVTLEIVVVHDRAEFEHFGRL